MTSSVTLTTQTAKVKPSTKLSFKWGVNQLFLLTLIFDSMGRLGQIGSIQAPCKILTFGTEIKKSSGGTFSSTHYQSWISKKCFWREYPTEHNYVTDYKIQFYLKLKLFYLISLLIIQSINESLSLINNITESPLLALTNDTQMNERK